MNKKYDIVVIGAGPAGILAAIAAAQENKNVLLCDHKDRPGMKLLLSGGGRCNLSNMLDDQAFMASFGRQGRFLQPALATMGRENFLALLAGIGVQTFCPDNMRIYPVSNSAASVLQALMARCSELGVQTLFNTQVSEILIDAREGVSGVCGVRTSQGDIDAGAVIVACGGTSYPQLGSDGSGYELARQAGHEIAPPIPALTGLLLRERWPGNLAGVAVSNARIWIDRKGSPKAGVRGDILFTHTGLSGPAPLDISGDVASILAHNKGDVTVRLDLLPSMSAGQWMQQFVQWQQESGHRFVISMLSQHLPYRLCEALCKLAHVEAPRPPPGTPSTLPPPQLSCAHLDRDARTNLATLLTALPLTVRATEGFDKAMVTRGGVKLKGVNPHTMESNIVGGLYLAGELLDLDGPCGGFNLQMAFATGYLAGLSAAKHSSAE